MKNSLVKYAVCGLLALAVAGAPTQMFGQEKKKDAPAPEKKEPAAGEKKKGSPPIRGKIGAVDKTAKTVTIGQTTIQITSETKIQKGGKEATLDDAAVGEDAMAMVNKSDDGKVTARRLQIGPRPEGEGKKGGKKKQKE
ncbi:MAG: hypothetical protein EXS35_08545 [Pedosphaera sp.]|nr:hypothetical protein [Pedosphaera sp.]